MLSMTTPLSPPTWPVDWALLPDTTDDPERATRVRDAVHAAVGVLWALTGRQYGLRGVEVRPCPPGAQTAHWVPLAPGPGWQPYIDAGRIFNAPTCVSLTCDRSAALLLPGPVYELLGWVVDGVEQPAHTLYQRGDLVWPTEGAWPAQDLSQPATQPGTFAIRYLMGTPPPPGAPGMVAALAAEYLTAAEGGTCRLPQRAQQVARQGVTVNLVDPQEIYERGATGLTEVDLWIKAHNPYGQAQPTTVWSPDLGVW